MDTYDRISKQIDAINDIVLDKLSDKDAREVMAYEAEILSAVSMERPRVVLTLGEAIERRGTR